MKNKALSYLIIFTGLILAINLSRSLIGLFKKGDIISESAKKLSIVKGENEELKKQLATVQQKDYIEKQAREKLNLGKEGEIVVILPSISPVPIQEKKEELQTWQKWIKLFN